MTRALGRLAPPDDNHIRSYPFGALAPTAPTTVNRVLRLPLWHWTHDQGHEGSCVGHGTAMERAITNTSQNILARILGLKTRRYDPIDIWNQAKLVDGDPNTNPGDDNGTYVRSAYDTLRNIGPCPVKTMELVNGIPTPVGELPRDKNEGIAANRWATTVDEVRAAIDSGIPCAIGINWYSNFDNYQEFASEHWIGRGDLGNVRGGHCVCIYGASDRRQAVRIKNSWGRDYPLVWMPYETLQRLINEDGEVAIVTDR